SLLLIDQIKSDLLDIDQSNDPRLRESLGPRLRREFVDMNRHVSTPRESSVLAEAVGANERYLAAQSGSLPGVSARLLADTYAKVQALRGINLDQAREARDHSIQLGRFADRLGLGLGVLVLAHGIAVVSWLRSRAFAPLL